MSENKISNFELCQVLRLKAQLKPDEKITFCHGIPVKVKKNWFDQSIDTIKRRLRSKKAYVDV